MYDWGRDLPDRRRAEVCTWSGLLVKEQAAPHDGSMPDTLHPTAVRIGSAERSAVAERLVAHYQAGQLPRQELELRLTKVAHAHTDDDLHLLTLDLPDVAGPARVVPPMPGPALAVRPTTSPLRVAFDVMLLLLTFSAGICLVLLLILVGASNGPSAQETLLVSALAAFGAFTLGAGGVHLLHRAFGSK